MEAGEARLGCPKHFSCEVHRVGVQIAVARQSANLAHAVKVLASPSLAKVVKSQSSSCASAAATLIDGRCLFGGVPAIGDDRAAMRSVQAIVVQRVPDMRPPL